MLSFAPKSAGTNAEGVPCVTTQLRVHPCSSVAAAQVYLTVTLSQYALAQFLASVEPLFLDTIEVRDGLHAWQWYCAEEAVIC